MQAMWNNNNKSKEKSENNGEMKNFLQKGRYEIVEKRGEWNNHKFKLEIIESNITLGWNKMKISH